MIKGNQRETVDTERKFYVGLTSVSVVAVNPTRAELNKLLGKEDSDEDEEINYSGEDKEGNDRVRLTFWLFDEKNGKYFPYSFNLTNKLRVSKDGKKVQLINQTLDTTWVPFVEGTEDPDESLIASWFANFTDKEDNVIATKTYRKALLGEEELGKIVRTWLGGLNFSNESAEVFIDPAKLLKEDYAELQELVEHEYTRPFVALLGVKTDQNDPSKKYQQVFGKAFLPNGFMKYVEKNFKGVGDYVKKTWAKFDKDVNGEYGFDGHTELVPLKEYNPNEDPAGGEDTRDKGAPTSPKF